MTDKQRGITDPLEVVDHLFAGYPGMQELVGEERVHAQVARQIYHLRIMRGMTQTELARAVGTTQSVVACLENADYEGHSLRMLRRIAAGLGVRVVVGFVETGRVAS